MFSLARRFIALTFALAFALAMPVRASAYDLTFDYTSFEATFKKPQFDVLNYRSINGQYMNTSTDNYRGDMIANGNELAQFYNWLTDRYVEQTVKDGAAAADVIHQYTMNNSYNTAFNPPRPNWIVLNEISPSLWSANPGAPSLSTYRTWLINLVTRLHDVHGYNVITLAPFQEPQQNNLSWQALQQKSYIGIECYLSGPEVWNSGSTYAERLAWAQQEYQDSKNAYMARGVPADRLFVTEHFANNGTHLESGREIKWGRAGLASASDWDQVIMIRQDAIYNVGFDGFLAYNWGGNGMGVTEAEQIQHEYYYRSRLVLPTQKPQWLSDGSINVNGTVIPLSWSQPLNWKGGVPNAPGAEVNFWRTNTTARTITLDGNKTVGKMLVSSNFAYNIAPGTGGSIVFDNAGSDATLTSNQSNHSISTSIQLNSNLVATVDSGTFTMSGAISGNGGLTKAGTGTLTISGNGSYLGDTVVQAGRLNVNGPRFSDFADLHLTSGSLLNLNFSGATDVIDSLFINGIAQPTGIWGGIGSGAEHTTSLIIGGGKIRVATYGGPDVPGDFTDNGIVDITDYITWRMGSPSLATEANYQLWRENYGRNAFESNGAGAGGALTAVPEPSTAALGLLMLTMQRFFSRGPRRR